MGCPFLSSALLLHPNALCNWYLVSECCTNLTVVILTILPHGKEHLSLLCKDKGRAPERQTLGKGCQVIKHSGLQFLKNVSSSEHRTPRERSHWLKGTSLKAGDKFGARGWIHGCRYYECWDTYSSQSKKLRSVMCVMLWLLLISVIQSWKALLAASLFFTPTSRSSTPSGWSCVSCQQVFEEVGEFSKDTDRDVVRPGHFCGLFCTLVVTGFVVAHPLFGVPAELGNAGPGQPQWLLLSEQGVNLAWGIGSNWRLAGSTDIPTAAGRRSLSLE